MADEKIIAVVGATGAQGGGLVRAILNDKGGAFSVRALTRDVDSEKARALASQGAEVFAADVDDVESLISDSPAALLVAERGGEIIGALIAGWDGWRGNMYRLAVREDLRRQGIGIALTRAGEEYLRGCGAGRVTALVAFEDEVAGAFWESAGYPRDEETGRRVR